MAKPEKDMWGNEVIRDKQGKKIGTVDKNKDMWGNTVYRDNQGKKTGHTSGKRDMWGNTNHYDAHGKKTGYTESGNRDLFGRSITRDTRGRAVGYTGGIDGDSYDLDGHRLYRGMDGKVKGRGGPAGAHSSRREEAYDEAGYEYEYGYDSQASSPFEPGTTLLDDVSATAKKFLKNDNETFVNTYTAAETTDRYRAQMLKTLGDPITPDQAAKEGLKGLGKLFLLILLLAWAAAGFSGLSEQVFWHGLFVGVILFASNFTEASRRIPQAKRELGFLCGVLFLALFTVLPQLNDPRHMVSYSNAAFMLYFGLAGYLLANAFQKLKASL